MVYYIRLLKPPKLDLLTHTVRALVTVTTDLGDDFYPGTLNLHAILVTLEEDKSFWQSEWQIVRWKAGMRTAWIGFRNLDRCPRRLFQLLVSTKPDLAADNTIIPDMPEILSAWSDSFGWEGGQEKFQAHNRIQRRYRTDSIRARMIYENTGESIARHIWDAGLTLAAFLGQIVSQLDSGSSLVRTLSQSMAHAPNIIELGSGCGIVGLELAVLCPESDVLLTDLPDAMDILNHNIGEAKLSTKTGEITSAILDWKEPLPKEIGRRRHDLVVVSDCTYNSDSIPALVNTLTALIRRSPDALIVVSMKIRHESEAIFFDSIAAAGLVENDHTQIVLPDRQRQEVGRPLEAVDIYVYMRNAES